MTAKNHVTALAAVFLCACGIDQNPARTDEAEPEPAAETAFDRIENDSDAKIQVVEDGVIAFPDGPWSLTCQETNPDRLQIEAKNGTLTVKARDNETGADCELLIKGQPIREIIVRGQGDLQVDEPMLDLERVEARGNGQISFVSIDAEALTMEAHGDGEFRVNDLRAQSLDLTVAGRGDSMLFGKVASGDVKVTGIGDLLATELEFRDLYIEVRSAGNASVFVTESIDGIVSGDGNLDVWGSPEGEIEEKGSGHVYFHEGPPPREE